MNESKKRLLVETIKAAETFIFLATLASGVPHYIRCVKWSHGIPFAQIAVRPEHVKKTFCDACHQEHCSPLPLDMGFTLENPPFPTADKLFHSYPMLEYDPDMN